jgi:hypothetical protein
MAQGFSRGFVLTVALGVAGTADAHEFIVKPDAMTVQAGAELQVSGLSSHIFLTSKELEDAKDVKIGVYANGKRADIAAKPNEKTLAYDGTVIAPSNGTFIVTGARLPPGGGAPAQPISWQNRAWRTPRKWRGLI